MPWIQAVCLFNYFQAPQLHLRHPVINKENKPDETSYILRMFILPTHYFPHRVTTWNHSLVHPPLKRSPHPRSSVSRFYCWWANLHIHLAALQICWWNRTDHRESPVADPGKCRSAKWEWRSYRSHLFKIIKLEILLLFISLNFRNIWQLNYGTCW